MSPAAPGGRSGAVPELDARGARCIDDAAAQRFREAGLLVLRGLLHGEELAALQGETRALVERAAEGRVADSDFQYKRHETTGEEVPFRVEYVVERTSACKALLGHPFVLRSVEKLQGRDFVPTWDSMVFKPPRRRATCPASSASSRPASPIARRPPGRAARSRTSTGRGPTTPRRLSRRESGSRRTAYRITSTGVWGDGVGCQAPMGVS